MLSLPYFPADAEYGGCNEDDCHHHGTNPNERGGLNRGGTRKRLEIGGIGWRGYVQRGGGETSMIT